MDHRLTQFIYFLVAANLCVLSEGLEGAKNQTTNRTRVRERRDVSCFRQHYGTSGPVLTSNTYSTDAACIDLCLNTSGCQAAVTSPMFWESTGCYAIGNYIMVRAPGWAIAERLCFDKNGWLPVNRAEYHDQGWLPVKRAEYYDQDIENSPLEIKTHSKLGSKKHVVVDFVNDAFYFAGGFRIRFSSQPKYYISGCTGWLPFDVTLPTTREKIWRITLDKSAGIHVIIHCHGVQVLDVTLSDEKCSSTSSWNSFWSRDATKIYFASSDTASIFYRTYSD